MQLLRHIADAQRGAAGDAAFGGGQCADQSFEKAGLARAVRTHDGNDFATINVEIDMAEDGCAALFDAQVLGFDQAHWLSVSRQRGHTPSISSTVRSIWKPSRFASVPMVASTFCAPASTTELQARQIRKAGA